MGESIDLEKKKTSKSAFYDTFQYQKQNMTIENGFIPQLILIILLDACKSEFATSQVSR